MVGAVAMWHMQPLDHFNFDPTQPLPTWQQRYLLEDQHWGAHPPLANGCRGPILFYSGNEGPIDAFYSSNGFMTDVLAPKLGALLVFGEARYYGLSQPQAGSARFDFLSTEQILADFAELLTGVKESLNATLCPVVSFGGSYGGTLTTLLRLKYPHVVVGGLAASAPLGYYDMEGWSERGVTPFTWFDTVRRVYTEAGCYQSLVSAVQDVRASLDTPQGRAAVASAFSLCADISAPEAFLFWITEVLESIPQVNYPEPSGGLPARPVNAACRLFEAVAPDDSNRTIAALATVTQWYYSSGSGGCIADAENPQRDGGVPGDGPQNGSAWGYQSCTETLHHFSVPDGAWRSYTFNGSQLERECMQYFGVRPRPSWLATWSGGYRIADLKTTSNLIWSNGLLDPWHGGGFLRKGDAVPGGAVFVMRQTAHHQDLRAPCKEDPAELSEVRQNESALILQWIEQASSAPVAPAVQTPAA